MIRVLHLCDQSADYQTTSAIQSLRSDKSGTLDVSVKSIGRGGNYGLPVLAVAALRRGQVKQPQVIHAWGPAALRVAAFAGSAPIAYSPTSDPDRAEIGWVRSVMPYREIHIVSPTDTVRRRFVERGVPIDRCHLIRPGVSFANIRRRPDEALRASLGLSPDDRVTLAVGESTRQSCHEDALYALTLLNVLDRRNRLLIWGRGPHAPAVQRFAKRLQQPTLINAQRTLGRLIPFELLLTVADDILITATGPIPTYPICLCMAAGLPIVASVTPTVAELLEDRHTALFVGRHTPRIIAQRILDLRSDTNVQWAISDMARTEAYEFFSQTRFLEQHRSVYQQISSGNRVELSQPAPGPGLRFHGRA